MFSLHRRRRTLLIGTALAGAAILACMLRMAQTSPARAAGAPAGAVVSARPSQDPDVLRFAPGAEQLASITSERVTASTLPQTDALSARLVYDEDATARIGVGITGRILALAAAPGASVHAGQVLATIDSPDLGTAIADLDKARADEQRKALTAERARDLVPGEAISAKDWEAIQADLLQARAETARATQRLKNLDPAGLPRAGQRYKLVSPIGGVVTERNATPGLEVNPSLAAPLFVVSSPDRLWLLIDLPEQLLAQVKVGGTVSVDSDAWPGQPFSAKIASLGQLVDPNTRRVTVRAVLDNTGHKLLPEMFVRARLLRTGGTGIAVPNSAIVTRGRKAYVFVQTTPDTFTRRQVTLATQGSDTSFVASGLAAGTTIVTVGALLLDAELAARADEQP